MTHPAGRAPAPPASADAREVASQADPSSEHTAVARFGHRHVALPFGPLHTELPLAEIDVAPPQRHHFATPQSGAAPSNTIRSAWASMVVAWCGSRSYSSKS